MTENKTVTEDIDNFVRNFPFAEEIRGKRFLITGATGLIGSILVKCLLQLNNKLDLGIEITATARNRDKAHKIFGDTPVKWVFQDAAAPLNSNEVKADYIIHLANPTSSRYFVEHPAETLLTTIEGTRSILEYTRSTNTESMVYVSSLEVYGTNDSDNALSEEFQGYVNPLDVRSSYNMGKRAAESLCYAYSRQYEIPVKIARLTQTFGAGVDYDDNRVFAQFSRKIVENKDIELHTDGLTYRMYCYTTDAVMAIFYLLIKGKNGEAYNVANPDTYISIRDMAQMLVDSFGHGSKVVVSLKNDMGYAPTTKLKLNTSRLEALGWKPYYTLREMFNRLISHYQYTSNIII